MHSESSAATKYMGSDTLWRCNKLLLIGSPRQSKESLVLGAHLPGLSIRPTTTTLGRKTLSSSLRSTGLLAGVQTLSMPALDTNTRHRTQGAGKPMAGSQGRYLQERPTSRSGSQHHLLHKAPVRTPGEPKHSPSYTPDCGRPSQVARGVPEHRPQSQTPHL